MIKAELRWTSQWAGRGGSRRWGWEAGFGPRSGISSASSRRSCRVYNTPRCHICRRQKGPENTHVGYITDVHCRLCDTLVWHISMNRFSQSRNRVAVVGQREKITRCRLMWCLSSIRHYFPDTVCDCRLVWEWVCMFLCVSPGDTLQYLLLVLVQTHSEGRVSNTADLHLVHLHLRHAQLLQKDGDRR